MREIIDRQTFLISVNMFNFNTGVNRVSSQVNLPMNLRFAADELVLKHISYNSAIPPNQATADINDMVQIWCNITNDNLIGSFTNSGPNSLPVNVTLNNHFTISNYFQTGNFVLSFQQTGSTAASYNPQPLISSQGAPPAPLVQTTFGVVAITIEFLKHSK